MSEVQKPHQMGSISLWSMRLYLINQKEILLVCQYEVYCIDQKGFLPVDDVVVLHWLEGISYGR